MSNSPGKRVTVCKWLELLGEASEREKWGQIIEASERYETLLKQLTNPPSNAFKTEREQQLLSDIQGRLQSLLRHFKRSEASAVGFEGSKHQSTRVREMLQTLLLVQYTTTTTQTTGKTDKDSCRSAAAAKESVCITIVKVGVRDPEWLCQPFINISVRGIAGELIEPQYETDYSSNKDGKYVIFNKDFILRTPFKQLPKDSSIMFELKHYNPSKRAVAVKCWSVLEINDLREGPQELEIYKRPTSIAYHRFNLFSRKKLYLHINVART